MAVEKDAWERGECKKNAMVDDEGESGDDEKNSGYNWGRVHHGKRHGTHRDQ